MTACYCTGSAPHTCSGGGLPRLATGACSCECHDLPDFSTLSADERLERLCGHEMTAIVGYTRHGVTLTVRRRDGTGQWKGEGRDLRAAIRIVAAMVAAGNAPREETPPEVHSVKTIRDAGGFLPAVEAATLDPRGRVARLWVSTDERDAPADCLGEMA